LAAHNKLSQPQLTTIVLSGMISQYPIASFVGYLVDRKGPEICSLIAAFLFALGFGGFCPGSKKHHPTFASICGLFLPTYFLLLADWAWNSVFLLFILIFCL